MSGVADSTIHAADIINYSIASRYNQKAEKKEETLQGFLLIIRRQKRKKKHYRDSS